MSSVLSMLPGADPMYDLVKNEKVATLSSSYKGTPFGSLIVYAIDTDGIPFIFISDLAQHTKNLTKQPKCSLMVSKIDKEDVSNSARITFAGKMKKVTDEKEWKRLREIYLKANPNSETFIDFGDFNFYKLDVKEIQYIGGFGDINWVDPKDYVKGYKK